jgi:hypothetical protein
MWQKCQIYIKYQFIWHTYLVCTMMLMFYQKIRALYIGLELLQIQNRMVPLSTELRRPLPAPCKPKHHVINTKTTTKYVESKAHTWSTNTWICVLIGQYLLLWINMVVFMKLKGLKNRVSIQPYAVHKEAQIRHDLTYLPLVNSSRMQWH